LSEPLPAASGFFLEIAKKQANLNLSFLDAKV